MYIATTKLKFLKVLTLIIFCTAALAQSLTSPSTEEANALFQAQKWTEAAKAYEAIAKAKPGDGRAWFRLGVSLHKSGQFASAVKAYKQALEKMPEQARPLAMYNLAASYARLNDKDKAFEWIDKAFNAGFSQAALLNSDSDLQTLREDKARFQALAETAERLTKPCLYQPEHKQFDFWIGEWNVRNAQGQPVGTSHIERIENGCIILENWMGGGTGKSLNFYDANLRKWRQTWADSTGGVSEFAGVYRDGAMRFEGESHTPDGTRILRRLTFFNLGADRVRQYSEASMDDGKTWGLDYDFIYLRKNSATSAVVPSPETIKSDKADNLTVEDRAAIRALDATFVQGWLKDDMNAVLSVFAQDAILLPPGSNPVQGISAIHSYWFPDDGSHTKITSFDRHIEEIGGNRGLAFLRGTASLSWTYEKDGQKTSQTSRSIDLFLLARDSSGNWHIIRQMWTALPK